ncbi:MAG: glycoside hydrolase family 95 protein [Candidatus Pacebacteria bacterium]|nr:glycoside hydrolase family 95 protein [Candidatus Paceibacterota bacterium]
MKTPTDQRLKRIARHDFVRTSPSSEWVEGMILGNGDIGVMAWGPPTHRTLTVNKSDVWDYRTPNGTSNLPPQSLEDVRRMVTDGDKHGLNELGDENTANSGPVFPTIQPCATACIEIAGGSQTWAYKERLSMASAEVNVDYTPFDKYWKRPGGIHETTIVCATRPVVAMQLRCDDGKPHGHRVTLCRNENVFLPSPAAGADADTIWLIMRFPDGLISLTAMAFDGLRVETSATDTMSMASLRDGGMSDSDFENLVANFEGTKRELDALDARGPQTFEIYLTTVRGYGNENELLAEARQNLKDARNAGFDQLRRDHREWWREYWSRAYLEINYPAAERLWFLGLYALGSSSRQGRQAAGLQGVWSNQDGPPWNSDYHDDINVQATYWSCHAADHLEQATPFFDLYEHMAEQARSDTKEYYKSDGMKLPMGAGPDGHELVGHYTCSMWPGGTAWLMLHFWWHYEYTLDNDWLKNHAWPMFVNAARFYEDYLLPDGKGGLRVFPSYSPEQVGKCPESLGTNSTCDLALIKGFLKCALAAGEVLEADNTPLAKWRDILEKLPDYPTIERPYSIKGEWATRFKDLEERDFDFHTAHLPLTLSPVYPAANVTAWTGSETHRKTAMASLNRLKERTGHGARGGFAGEYIGFVQANLGLDNAFTDLAGTASKHVRGDSTAEFTGFFGRGPSRKFMQMDWIFGYPGPLMECLLQSHDGILRVFPAVDSDFTGTFEGFRAKGGYRVSACMEHGVVQWIELESLCETTCRVAIPWDTTTYCVNDDPPRTMSEAILTIDVTPGDRVTIQSAVQK